MLKSNYGFPKLDLEKFSTYNEFVQKLPDIDNEIIFGFNPLIEKSLKVKNMTSILEKMLSLKKRKIIQSSPLDAKIKEDNDYKVFAIAQEILKQIKFSLESINEINAKTAKLKASNSDNPILVFANREIKQYHFLL